MLTVMCRRLLLAASALLLLCACGQGVDGGGSEAAADEKWQAVLDYLALDTAWHDSDAKDRGPHPEIEQAVAAARAIVAEASHPQFAAAAEFLMEHPAGLSETAAEDMALGLSKLKAHVGANWDEITGYRERQAEWMERYLHDGPKALRAMVAAAAIVDEEGHENRQQAAEFLLLNSHTRGIPREVVANGAKTLLDHFPNYDGWQRMFDAGAADDLPSEILEAIANRVEDPTLKATARYHLAANLIDDVNAPSASTDERDRLRARAKEAVAGLSEGVADQEFKQPRFAEDGTQLTGTFAQAEAELLFRLDHATAGGTLPHAEGTRLDGKQEDLTAYAGKVVLVDFWATWCAPCIKALPTLRDLHGELSTERFALLSISVDDELETVTTFLQDEPMPWPSWHVGSASEVSEAWNIKAFPTYILVDGDGRILARTHQLDDRLIGLVKEAVNSAA